MALLEINNLKKAFPDPDGIARPVIDIPEFRVDPAQQIALSGDSGSGKSTFLNLIAGILEPDSGGIRLDGVDVAKLGEPERDRLRATKIGYIFQTFNLLQGFTVIENVLLGMSFGPGADRPRARALLDRVGLSDRVTYYPGQLSTGQQQRVAVARALANRPRLILADEPTGNLDRVNAAAALKLIRETCAEIDAALLLVSHDPSVLRQFEWKSELAEINRAATQPREEQS